MHHCTLLMHTINAAHHIVTTAILKHHYMHHCETQPFCTPQSDTNITGYHVLSHTNITTHHFHKNHSTRQSDTSFTERHSQAQISQHATHAQPGTKSALCRSDRKTVAQYGQC